MDDFNLFALTRTNTTNTLEKIGNFFLTPSRIAWNGYTVSLVKIKDTPLVMHEAADANHEYHLNPFFRVLLGIVGAITFIPGSIFKGLSYLNEEVRNKHLMIKESFEEVKPFTIQASSEQELCEKLAEIKPHVSFMGSTGEDRGRTFIQVLPLKEIDIQKECELFGKKVKVIQMIYFHKIILDNEIFPRGGRDLAFWTNYNGDFTHHFNQHEIDISEIML